jgi:hypothetical protein
MGTGPLQQSTPIKKLSSRIRELLPELGSASQEGEINTLLNHLQDKGEAKSTSEWTVPTHLRRIFAILAPLESPAAKEARELIKNYAASTGITL